MEELEFTEQEINEMSEDLGISAEKLSSEIARAKNSDLVKKLIALRERQRKIAIESEEILADLVLSSFGFHSENFDKGLIAKQNEEIGKFIVRFSQLERVVRTHYLLLVKCSPILLINTMYSLDLSLLLQTLKSVYKEKYFQRDIWKVIEQTIGECFVIVQIRNDISHGHFYNDRDGNITLVKHTRGKLGPTEILKGLRALQEKNKKLDELTLKFCSLLHYIQRDDFAHEMEKDFG